MLKDYVKLLKRMAWSYHRSTGIEWEELYAETLLAYVKAKHSFTPNKGGFSTHLYVVTQNQLREFIFAHRRQCLTPVNIKTVQNLTPEAWVAFREALSNLSEDALAICNMILSSPADFASLPQLRAMDAVKEELQQAGWSGRRQRRAFHEIRNVIACS